MSIKTVLLSTLQPRPDARPISEQHVDELALSIHAVGLLELPVVREVGEMKEVLAGLHRVHACRDRLGWDKITCNVVALTDEEAELASIEDHMATRALSPAQTAKLLARRKFLYEKLHPETKQHTSGGKGRHGRAAGDILPFAQLIANKVGKDRRSIERAIEIGNKIPGDILNRVVGTSLDYWSELRSLISLTEAEQEGLVRMAEAGEDVSARESHVGQKGRTDTERPESQEADDDSIRPSEADIGEASVGHGNQTDPADINAGVLSAHHNSDDVTKTSDTDGPEHSEISTEPDKSSERDVGSGDVVIESPQANHAVPLRATFQDGSDGVTMTEDEETHGVLVSVGNGEEPALPSIVEKLGTIVIESYTQYLKDEVDRGKESDKDLYLECLKIAETGRFYEDIIAEWSAETGRRLARLTIAKMRKVMAIAGEKPSLVPSD